MPLLDMRKVHSDNRRLAGAFATRADMWVSYTAVVAELQECTDDAMLECYLASISDKIESYREQTPHLWEGDGYDFIGLEAEIELQREHIHLTSFGMIPEGDPARHHAENE